MIHLLVGEDDYSITQTLKQFEAELGAGDMADANIVRICGDKMTPDELGLFIAASPFLAPRRLVIASGVLERFETIAARRSGGNNKHKSNQQDLAQAFSQAIMSAPESTLLVMVCRTLSRNNMLLELIGSHVKRQDFPVIKGVDLQRWISERISIAGGTIKQDALQLLVNRLDTDLWRLSNEIKKLLLYCVDGTITVKEVEQLVALSDEASIFKLVDLVMNSNTSLAQAELSKLLQEGTSPFQVISMLARQVRLIILAKEMLRENLKRPDIQAKLNIKHEFILRKTIEQARLYKDEDLKTAYNRILGADLDMKTSRYDYQLALNLLVEDLAHNPR